MWDDLVEMRQAYGSKLLVMIFATQHLLKGFAFGYIMTAMEFIFRFYGVSAGRIQIYRAVAMSPWALKPVVGLLSDSLPIGGYRKRYYIVISTVFAVVAASALALNGRALPLAARADDPHTWGAPPFAEAAEAAEDGKSRGIGGNRGGTAEIAVEIPRHAITAPSDMDSLAPPPAHARLPAQQLSSYLPSSILLLLPPNNFLSLDWAVICLALVMLQVATADLLVEARFSEEVRRQPRHGPTLMMFVWGGNTVGGLVATGSVGFVLEHQGAFAPCALAVLPSFFVLVPLLLDFLEEDSEAQRAGTEPLRLAVANWPTANYSAANSVGADETRQLLGGGEEEEEEEEELDSKENGGGSFGTMRAAHRRAGGAADDDDDNDDDNDDDDSEARPPPRGEAPAEAAVAQATTTTATETVERTASVMRLEKEPAPTEITFLTLWLGAVALSLVWIGLRLADVYLQCSLAASLALMTLIFMSVIIRRDVAVINAFCFIQTSLAISIDGGTFYFFTNGPLEYPDGPHFSPWFYTSGLGVVAAAFNLVGMLLYHRYLKHWTYRDLYFVASAMYSAFASLSTIVYLRLNVGYVDDHAFVLTGSVLLSVVHQAMWLPTSVLLSNLCPRGCEAIMFALLAGSHNLGHALASYIGAAVLEVLGVTPNGSPGESDKFDNMWIAGLIQTGLPCLSLVMVPWCIPNRRQTERLVDNDYDDKLGAEKVDLPAAGAERGGGVYCSDLWKPCAGGGAVTESILRTWMFARRKRARMV